MYEKSRLNFIHLNLYVKMPRLNFISLNLSVKYTPRENRGN